MGHTTYCQNMSLYLMEKTLLFYVILTLCSGTGQRMSTFFLFLFFFVFCFFEIIYLRHFIITLLTYKAYRYMITLLLYSNYLTVQIYNTE